VGERKQDQALHIRTVGLREWGKDGSSYNRYEATPYTALDKLFETYKLTENDRLVDFGSGRGRVAFYIHNRFGIPITGIEANDKTFDEALKNKQTYRKKRQHIAAPITFIYGLAEQYDIDDEDNRFFLFNPFSVKIFKQVIKNIKASLARNDRTIELILYYPLEEFKEAIRSLTQFEMINKINVPGDHGKYGKFVIYRHTANDN